MTEKGTYIRIQIYDKGSKMADIKGDDIPRELKHAKNVFYRKKGIGGN